MELNELKNCVWAISKTSLCITAKDIRNGLTIKEIPINKRGIISPLDLALLNDKIYILDNSNLWSVNIWTHKIHLNELEVHNYHSLVATDKEIYIIGNVSYRFSPKSKLCRIADIKINGVLFPGKCYMNGSIYFIGGAKEFITDKVYQYECATQQTIELPLKLPLGLEACGCFPLDNNLMIVGGRTESSCLSNFCYWIEMENQKIYLAPYLYRNGFFRNTSCAMSGDLIGLMDENKNLHVYNKRHSSWKFYSEFLWKKRANFIWVWRMAKKNKCQGNIDKLPLSLVMEIAKYF
ncbi:unnamed protein product [Blepharisma stoltei]|uniref:Uncharacterized protein n=1 Tax=Blepharisma stoltei TaxID=1481888 RepID=A0AAU9IP75_9CILI|nr:unnamed protein product [Blepharisma stoltei]